ncbi:MAG: hypothetical protein F7O42_09345 [Opitutae bacterium]|nr:hypothetical protein [Opitutae bacterium]
MNKPAILSAFALAATLFPICNSEGSTNQSPAHSLESDQSNSAYFDIVVYGGTSAAVTSAVQARRMGKTYRQKQTP